MTNLPMAREPQPPAVPAYPAPRVAYCYPLTPQRQPAALGVALRKTLATIEAAIAMADRMDAIAAEPYGCALCPTDLTGRSEWECARHFAQHPLKERVRVLGWRKALATL